MGRLIYVPLEPYRERYTMQLSAAKTGWYERNWIKAGVTYERVEPIWAENLYVRTINKGRVLDAIGRSRWAMAQIDRLLCMLSANEMMLSPGAVPTNRGISASDAILFDDFWHPGIEALQYAFDQYHVRPRMYAYCWAQSVDEFDFTYNMRSWMRPFETGIARMLDGIFVANTMLKDLLVEGGVTSPEKIHVVGLPFSSEEVMLRMPAAYQNALDHPGMDPMPPRKNQVVFSSRWDWEKDPWFFLKVGEQVLKNGCDATFVICTSAPKLRSNDSSLPLLLQATQSRYPGKFEVRENLTKGEYYEILTESKVQFNCANQDWVSFSLLEASVAGCYPLYPYFRSFPETFSRKADFLYPKDDVQEAARRICGILDRNLGFNQSLWAREAIQARSWIHSRFDYTWTRMLRVMRIAHDISDEDMQKAVNLYAL